MLPLLISENVLNMYVFLKNGLRVEYGIIKFKLRNLKSDTHFLGFLILTPIFSILFLVNIILN